MGDMCKTFEVGNFLVQENGIVRDRDTGLFLFRLDDAERFTWQPIETAPKDKDILVFVSDGEDSFVDIANWQEYYPDGFNWAHARCVDGLHIGGDVTHWMPLPAPPAGA